MYISRFLKRLAAVRLLTSLMVLVCATALGLLAPVPAHAIIGANDNVPAATLLLPYFEVDLNNNNGVQTSIRVSNASASAAMLNVTLWSDWGLPTKSFSIYLTGLDTTEIDLRMVFKGHLPRTADAGSDPTNKISPKGPYSQDINFPGNGAAAAPQTTLLTPTDILNLRNAHTGVASGTFGGMCGSKTFGDGVARGYVTIDSMAVGMDVDEMNPSTPGYFSGPADMRNILLGSYTVTNRGQRFVTTDAMVHIEASMADPLTATQGNPTFYSRFNALPGNNIDYREPLSSVWNTRYVNSGFLTGGTRLRVWRDPVVTPTPVACGGLPAAFPLGMRELAAFDEQEQVAVSPLTAGFPVAGSVTAFPIATQSVSATPLTPFSFGAFRLNFNDPGSAPPFSGSRQAHVSAYYSTTGSFAMSIPGLAIAPHRVTPGDFTFRIAN